jgi:hypothetical protein
LVSTSSTTATAVAEQPSCAAGAACYASSTGAASAPVAEKQSAGPACLPGAGGAVRTVADEGASQKSLGWCVDCSKRLVKERNVGGFRIRIPRGGLLQGGDEAIMKKFRLCAVGAVGASMFIEQRGDGSRHFI